MYGNEEDSRNKIQAKLVPPDWIDSIEINDYRVGGFKLPSADPISLFLRPSFTIPLLSDGAICFGAKYYYDNEPVFSDPRYRTRLKFLEKLFIIIYKHCFFFLELLPRNLFNQKQTSSLPRSRLQDARIC